MKDSSVSSSSQEKDYRSRTICGQSLSDSSLSTPVGGANPTLRSIPTVPIFSNAHQQERLRKWIAKIDLSVVDRIIDKMYSEGSDGQEGIEMYMCKKCKVLFRSLTVCRRHCAKHLPQKVFTCPDCDFATANLSALYSHYRNHTQNLYACDKCDFRARIKAHYRDHLETHNPSRYICRLCQKPYSTSNSLRSHIYLYHSNKDGMKYLWCLREKNQERRPKNVFFQCPVCDKLFGEKSAANWHLASHSLSASKDFMRCEVCYAETLNFNFLKKHMQKHKVVYICYECCKPYVSINCLRNHQKVECLSPQPETLRYSLLLSYTSPETFPSLLTNKRIGPLLQNDNIHHLSKCFDFKVSDSLSKQMQEVGYRQIYHLLENQEEGKSQHIVNDITKIVVDTRSAGENEQQCASWKHHHHPSEEWEQAENHPGGGHEQENCQVVEESVVYGSGDKISLDKDDNSQHLAFYGYVHGGASPIYMPDQDPTSGESDQRVVVISNVGEEQQTVVIEDGCMLTSEEERLVIINDDSVNRQHMRFSKFIIDND